jgi:hypothetical protein
MFDKKKTPWIEEASEFGLESVLAFAKDRLSENKEKAIRNKKSSNCLFRLVIYSSALGPVLIAIPEIPNCLINELTHRILPAFLMALSAISASLIQFKKPHEKWRLYREAQRRMEFEIQQCLFSIGEYKTSSIEKRQERLAENISQIAIKLHYDWEPKAPTTEQISNKQSNS